MGGVRPERCAVIERTPHLMIATHVQHKRLGGALASDDLGLIALFAPLGVAWAFVWDAPVARDVGHDAVVLVGVVHART